jgi:hypothetical protein
MFRFFTTNTGWKLISVLCLVALILTACQTAPASTTISAATDVLDIPVNQVAPTNDEMAVSQNTPVEVNTPAEMSATVDKTALPPAVEATSHPTLAPDDWQTLPVVPTEISQRAREIYQQGLAMGNDPTHFSKLGDCQNITTYFLAIYDHPDQYTLGEKYQDLQATIDYFQGSWARESKSVKGGFNVASVFNPIFSDRAVCEKNEAPLDCELRLYKPSIVLISMEEWWNGDVTKYENYLRRIIETVIAQGAVPVLATKADNLEGGHAINKAIVRLADEYELPLWNFWLAVQPITAHGLQKDGFHLTMGINDFTSSIQLKRGWVQRNLTALQVLDAVSTGLRNP